MILKYLIYTIGFHKTALMVNAFDLTVFKAQLLHFTEAMGLLTWELCTLIINKNLKFISQKKKNFYVPILNLLQRSHILITLFI